MSSLMCVRVCVRCNLWWSPFGAFIKYNIIHTSRWVLTHKKNQQQQQPINQQRWRWRWRNSKTPNARNVKQISLFPFIVFRQSNLYLPSLKAPSVPWYLLHSTCTVDSRLCSVQFHMVLCLYNMYMCLWRAIYVRCNVLMYACVFQCSMKWHT